MISMPNAAISTRNTKTQLTSDKMPFMVMLFGFPAGVMLIFAVLMGTQIFSTFQALDRGAPETATRCTTSYPTVCTEYNVRQAAVERGGIAVVLAVAATLLWYTGLRHRYVWLEGNTVCITWGKRLPLALHRYATQDIQNIAITKEARFVVMPIAGTSVTRVKKIQDRWRMRATVRGRSVNLGSYVTESAAQNAARAIRTQ
jgi:hypothetical protein